MNKKITFILISILLPLIGYSQSSRLKYANKLYSIQSYFEASEAFEDCLARKTDSSTVAKNIATCYDKIGKTQKALDWYRFLNRTESLSQEQHLRFALLERQEGNYAESETLMANYSNKYGELDVAKSVVNQAELIDKLILNSPNFELKIQEKVNTESSEIGTVYFKGDQVLIASSSRRRMTTHQVNPWTGKYFYDLYVAPVDKNGQIGEMEVIKSKVQSKFNDGPAVYDSTSGYFYFTRNNYLNGKKGMDENRRILLKIYRSKMIGDKFEDAEELSFNSDSYSNAHPSLSRDGKKIYFSSDRPGGLGGMDLYYVNLDDKGNVIGDPVNLGGKINTSQNELFPFYNDIENILFFSSEGHAGLGGMDIFVAKLNKQGQGNKVINLGAPINSSNDDLCFVSNPLQTMGYFSSNREGGKGDDDIYGFNQMEPIKNSPTIKGQVKDIIEGIDLSDATIYLTDKNGNIIDSVKTDKSGVFELSLNDLEGDFKIVGKKEGYLRAEQNVKYNPENSEYLEDLKFVPNLDYFFSGSITDNETGTPISDVKISAIDNTNNALFQELKTQEEGSFKTKVLPYKYDEKVNFSFKLEKEGYSSRTLDLSEILALKKEITVGGDTKLTMNKIGKGTDLFDAYNLNTIYFDLNSSYIRKDASIELDKIVKAMNDNPNMVIELGSHTDQRESDKYNEWLSDRRAKSSVNYIISRGISQDRITGKGYGESKPKKTQAQIDAAASEEEKEKMYQLNRRTEFIVVEMK